ncbi:MAG TPA: hypothetical protein VLS93_11525, partial [Anaeromyxobacteraceae bacterium]|nr:hypothetical protein [Anaeromyxobacteraceae bacterium]
AGSSTSASGEGSSSSWRTGAGCARWPESIRRRRRWRSCGAGPAGSAGFHFHEARDLVAAAAGAGFEGVRLVELHGHVTEGDLVLRASAGGGAG